MGEVVEVDAYRVEICTPQEAGAYDPSMQEWLALPVGEDGCPFCGSHHWGTSNPRGYFLVRQCHDQANMGCRAKFRSEVGPEMIAEIAGALTGKPRRFGMGPRRDTASATE